MSGDEAREEKNDENLVDDGAPSSFKQKKAKEAKTKGSLLFQRF